MGDVTSDAELAEGFVGDDPRVDSRVRVFDDFEQGPVVEPSPFEVLVGEREAERSEEVEGSVRPK